MNGKKSKRIRAEVYGEYSPKFRKYARLKKTFQIISDPARRAYQAAKKAAKAAK